MEKFADLELGGSFDSQTSESSGYSSKISNRSRLSRNCPKGESIANVHDIGLLLRLMVLPIY